MEGRRIFQLLAGYSNGDAISNEARVMRAIFRGWGAQSEIVCEPQLILPELIDDAWALERYRAAARADDILILHLSIGTLINRVFAELPGRKVILYHNITPPHFFRGIKEKTARRLAEGRDDMRALAGVAELNLADSAFNAGELEEVGYRAVHVFPLVLKLEDLSDASDPAVLEEYGDGRPTILFVGRGVPNKCIDDLLYAFHYYQRFHAPAARFVHVGSYSGMEFYKWHIITISRQLGLENVELAESVRQDELNAYFSCADLFLSMSEHEGFGIPLIESMVHDLPVLAYAAAAVPETLDGAGVLFAEKRFDLVAAMIDRLVREQELRTRVIAGQRRRLERYRQRDLESELRRHLEPLL
jgi:L-malate glycosyltransferase